MLIDAGYLYLQYAIAHVQEVGEHRQLDRKGERQNIHKFLHSINLLIRKIALLS